MTFEPLVSTGAPLTDSDTSRYARHLSLPRIGGEGQRRLRNTRALVIGAGGLGSPTLLYLAAAGVGHITVIDDDTVDESNLQRQIIHRQEDIGRPKAQSAADAVMRLDSRASITPIVDRLTVDNALELFEDHDIVLDGADNFATRYLSNDASELTSTPLIWGTIAQFSGQVSVFWPGHGPTLRDLYPDIPDADSVPSCAAGGVLGALVGLVGSNMAIEAIKVITGIGAPAVGRLLMLDALGAGQRELRFASDPERSPVTGLEQLTEVCTITTEAPVSEVGVNAFSSHRDDYPLVIDVRETAERESAYIGGDVHIPVGTIESNGWAAVLTACDSDKHPLPDAPSHIIFYCHSGARSARAIRRLANDPATPTEHRLMSLSGGILAWSAGPGAELT